MEIHRTFKKNEHILEYFLSRLSSITFAVTLCSANEKWIDNFCNRVKLSYIKINELDMMHSRKIASMLLVRPSLLYVYTNGTEFWLIKAFMEKCQNFPSLIVTSFNYIMGTEPNITTPYPRKDTKKMFDINYQGCSIQALITMLHKYNYRYTGIFRYAQMVVFIRNDEYRPLSPLQEPNPSDILSLPNVKYALKKRSPQCYNK